MALYVTLIKLLIIVIIIVLKLGNAVEKEMSKSYEDHYGDKT